MNPKVEAGLLLEALRKVSIAVYREDEEHRYNNLRTVFLRFAHGRMTVVATDGHRLAIVESAAAYNGEKVEGTVALDAVAELRRVLKSVKPDALVKVVLAERRAAVGGRPVSWAKQAGQFPDWENVLPREEDFTARVAVDRDALALCFKRALIMADRHHHGARLTLAADGLTISVSSSETGEYSETISVQPQGKPLELGLNAAYALDFLAVSAPGPVHLAVRDAQSAMRWTALGEGSVRFSYILMPLRL